VILLSIDIMLGDLKGETFKLTQSIIDIRSFSVEVPLYPFEGSPFFLHNALHNSLLLFALWKKFCSGAELSKTGNSLIALFNFSAINYLIGYRNAKSKNEVDVDFPIKSEARFTDSRYLAIFSNLIVFIQPQLFSDEPSL